MAYDTNNPLGSKDPRDLYDNATNFDNYANGPDPMYPNRFGEMKLSIDGMNEQFSDAQVGREAAFQEFLANSAFVSIGDYAAGMTFTNRSQYMIRDGVAYRLATATSVPYTTTGNWALEAINFTPISSDDILRQDLASTGEDNGAGLVVFDPAATYPVGTVGAELSLRADLASMGDDNGAGLVVFDPAATYPVGTVGAALAGGQSSVANLTALRAKIGTVGEVVFLSGRTSGSSLGAGNFIWLADVAMSDNDGTVIGSDGTGRWYRIGTDYFVEAGWFGVNNDGLDYTSQLQAAINFAGTAAGASQGMVVRLPRGTVGIASTITIPNRVGVQGANGRGTTLKALAGFAGIYMISATNGTSSMFASWIRDLYIDARSITFTAVVYTTGWQETCNMERVCIQADTATANLVLYEVGAGGAAMWVVSDCEFFLDSTAVSPNGIRVNQVSSVGGFVLRVQNSTFAGSVTHQLFRGIYMVNDSLIADMVHFEYVTNAMLAGVAGNIDVRMATGSGNNVGTVVNIPSTFTGSVNLSCILPNGATNSLFNAKVPATVTGRISQYTYQ